MHKSYFPKEVNLVLPEKFNIDKHSVVLFIIH